MAERENQFERKGGVIVKSILLFQNALKRLVERSSQVSPSDRVITKEAVDNVLDAILHEGRGPSQPGLTKDEILKALAESEAMLEEALIDEEPKTKH